MRGVLAAGPCTFSFSSYRTASSECALSGRWRWCWCWPRELGSWAGRAGQVLLLLGGWGTEYLVLGAGCDGALLQAAHWATHWAAHTGHGVLSRPQGTCTCSLICLLASTCALRGSSGSGWSRGDHGCRFCASSLRGEQYDSTY